MDRRQTLKLGAALAAGSWIAACESEDLTPPSRAGRSPLERALEVSRGNGKPVFALVDVPESSTRIGRVASELAELDEPLALAHFALCEPVFASVEQVQAVVGAHPEVDSSGLIAFEGGAPKWRPVRLSYEPWRRRDNPLDDACARQNLGRLAEELTLDGGLARLAHAARAALPEAWVRSFERELATNTPIDPHSLHRGAALLLVHANRDAHLSALVEHIRQRLASKPIPGSRWARHDGCSAAIVSFLQSDDLARRRDLISIANTGSPMPRDSAGRPIPFGYVERTMALCGMSAAGDEARRFYLLYVEESV